MTFLICITMLSNADERTFRAEAEHLSNTPHPDTLCHVPRHEHRGRRKPTSWWAKRTGEGRHRRCCFLNTAPPQDSRFWELASLGSNYENDLRVDSPVVNFSRVSGDHWKVTDEAELVRYWPGGESACLHFFLVYNSTFAAALKSAMRCIVVNFTFEAKTRSETRVCTSV